MKAQQNRSICTVVFAAVTIIGFSLHALVGSEKRRAHDNRSLKEAMQNWEGEGGAVTPAGEEDKKNSALATQ